MTCPTEELCDIAYGWKPLDAHLEKCEPCRAGLERLRRERALFEAAIRVPARPAHRRPARWPHAGFAALLLLGLFALLFRSPEEVAVPASRQDDPEALVRQLGEEDIETRARAADALLKLGPKAEPALRRALESELPEVKAQARDLLNRLGNLRSRGKLWDLRRTSPPPPAVLEALKWLERHQSPDGSWSTAKHDVRCEKGVSCADKKGGEDSDVGVTALAVLAFTGAGRGLEDAAVANGLRWLTGKQDREGCVGERGVKHMYGHAIAALALADAYGLSGSDTLQKPVQRATSFTIAAQNPGAGWRYTPKCGDNDTSVTMWATLSLKTAWHAGIDVPVTVFEGTRAWFASVTDRAFFRVGYTHLGTGKVYIPGQNETFDHHETLTAGAVLSRLLLGEKPGSDACRSGMELLLRDQPVWNGNQTDFYYWHFGTLALFHRESPGSPAWKRWNDKVRTALVENQRPGGCAAGSWAPVDRWSYEGGTVYATALNALTLLTPTRFAR
jgi:hypothetical protein